MVTARNGSLIRIRWLMIAPSANIFTCLGSSRTLPVDARATCASASASASAGSIPESA